jgi:2-pyrone-4,6-dicarboxylate lactonase
MATDGESSQYPARVKASAPACDSHVHVFDPMRFPYVTPRRFTPGEATVKDLRGHMLACGLSRVVIVQPSVYGDNHDCLLSALNELGSMAQGIAVVSEHTTDAEIGKLNAAGVVGTRINLVVDHQTDPGPVIARLQAIERRIPDHWHVQWHVRLDMLQAIADHITTSARTHVLDHIGLPDLKAGALSHPWMNMLALMRSGKLYVKISAPYLTSLAGPPFTDLRPMVESLIETRADRVLWGSNWPHTQGSQRGNSTEVDAVETFRKQNDLEWLATCAGWAGIRAQDVRFGNAAQLYQFG